MSPTKLAPLQGTMLLLLLILLTTTITITASTPSSPSNKLNHPHFQELNVKQTIADTKLNPTLIPKTHQKHNTTKHEGSAKWKLNLLHRDKVTTFNATQDHRTRFNARMQRDAKRGRCRYEVSYGDGSYTKGTLALETLTFGRTVIRNVAIGCGHSNQGMFVGAAGLLGLGGGPMSFVGQLGGQTGGAFSYCLVSRGIGSSGSLEFGLESMPVGASWVSLIHNLRAPSFYYIGLSGLGVGGIKVSIPEDIFRLTETGDGGVVMDTGTAVTRLPTVAYNAFRDAFIGQTTNLPRASGVSIFDTCYDLYGFMSVRVPTVSFYFSGGPILTLPARNFLIPVDDVGTFCFAFAPSPSGLSIIGNIQQEGIEISVDGANGYVGFGPNVC
ncbi:hypothetical protein Ahy_A09g041854 [Arachis hypogaea]|uniref:Peptidase A1 domain-containing protein n=1 Tax=Arachis hypogaea TaxID=3818 RepID=A0A445BE51_ARAHY|nr:hypothetical protein Ahy_A09g041854 [Arachis hypogaea]